MSDFLKNPKGPIAWMVNNPVAANLLMAICLIGGLISFTNIGQEVFPDLAEEVVTIRVGYPGGTPEELEQGVCLVVEEAVRGLEGVKEVTATASEGSASVEAELLDGVNVMKVYQDIKSEIDRITTFPDEAEEPEVSLASRRRGAMTLVLYGEISDTVLRALAEQVRDRLQQSPEITQVDLSGTRDLEISVEVSQEQLRRYGLTHRGIASKINQEAIELSGGRIKTDSGETLLRMKERRDYGLDFAGLPVAVSEDGTPVRLGDIADVQDGLEDSDRFAFYNGKPAIMIDVYRVGEQTPTEISKEVYAMLPLIREQLPDGVEIQVRSDRTEIFVQRAELLLRNGAVGLMLVMLLLGFFLEIRLAFWVMMGIPISFLGSMLLMPALGMTINMITMFAYLIALGIVVDDAIVVGENIYHYQQKGEKPFLAAIKGCREVASPVGFSILTNVAAFVPLLVLPGMMGKMLGMLPIVVISVFMLSWLESIYILPAHLSHSRLHKLKGLRKKIHEQQQRFSNAFTRWVRKVYGPFLDRCLTHRYLVVSAALALLILIGGYWKSGRLGFSMFTTVESDYSVATVVLPYGSPIGDTEQITQRVVKGAQAVLEASGHPELVEGIFADVGRGGTHQAQVRVYLADAEVRDKIMSTMAFTQAWRKQVGTVPGVRFIRFSADSGGPGGGPALTVELRHESIAVLEAAAAELGRELEQFPLVQDVDDGVETGKSQFDFTMKPEGTALGLTPTEVGRQIRAAYQGAEALRQQRGRNEVKVRVRLPKEDRDRLYSFENFILRTPDGGEVLLEDAVDVDAGTSYTSIKRRNGMRALTLTADVRPKSKAGEVREQLAASVWPKIMDRYPGLDYSYEGRDADSRESFGSMKVTLPMVLVAIYALLAIPFKSYSQPLIVMISIPFGIIGAVIGHLIMGYDMTMIGIIGMLALSGVVVNDALVMISFANDRRAHHDNAHDAVVSAGIQRFRPIMLTTFTTFGGLAPMIFETSRQARFLIPMAISLGYGLLFATCITLLLVPSLYMIIEDIKGLREPPVSE
ncbi:efflux RND transporter permease subunit [Tichowtungia aerotolerans]|uniref:AcrB/AcrD/AcrF family protein n=1 Tax=Tichowtungia aerotolerans TaxID=2697043 RepID=A0A6P1M0E1_9BACT|nr:efflux RND transporter permease subunit [Tichowtungia aerotolerans]QHI68020.1 AcrB/AcrD/AcrF family protein [Tichowtungia aerotolerans]